MPPIPVPATTVGPTDAENGVCTGELDGNFATTFDGAATFRIPLWVPPGRNGMSPDLALVYDSRAGDGALGVGWSLAGLRTITRTRCRYLDEDGPVRPVRFDSTDHFTLDGQTLVLIAGDNAVDGAEYRTQRETFSRIVVKGSDALGPLAFELRSRDGRILTFEADDPVNNRIAVVVTDDKAEQTYSPVRYSWSLRRTADRNGNFIDIDYGLVSGPPGSAWAGEFLPTIHFGLVSGPPLGGEFLPTQISYTGFSSHLVRENLAPTKSVRFIYGSHPEASITYVAGLEIRRAARLERIEMWGPDASSTQLLRLYELTYSVSAISGRSLLHTVRECDGWPSTAAPDGTPPTLPPRAYRSGVCKRPLVFEWEYGSPAFSEPFQQGLPSLTPDITSLLRGRMIPADLNGDGCDDLICMIPADAIDPKQLPGDSYYAFIIADGAGLGGLQITSRYAPPDMRPRPLDFDMDGQIEVMTYVLDASQSPPKPAAALSRIVTDSVTGQVRFNDVQSFPVGDYDVADFDGAGLASLILPIDSGTFWHNVNGEYFDGPLSLPVPPIGDRRVVGVNLAFDVDGDGAVELLCPRYKKLPSGGLELLPQQLILMRDVPPDGLPYIAVSPGKPPVKVSLISGETYVFADLNGDGLLDAITFDPAASSPPSITVVINTGNGFVYGAPQAIPTIDFRTAQVRVIDYCADGKQQLLVRPLTGHPSDPMRILRWNGAEFIDIPLSTDTLWTDAATYGVLEVLDANGNGLGDFAMLNYLRPTTPPVIGPDLSDQTGFSQVLPELPPSLQLYQRLGKKPDMLVGITNALGAVRTIVYEPLTNRSVYSATTPTAYPLYATRAKAWVVAQTSATDGIGGETVLNYRYEDGRLNLLGEGFLGFCAHEVTDAQTGTTTHTKFDLSTSVAGIHPLVGLPVDTTRTWDLGGGLTRIRKTHTDYTCRTNSTGRAVFAFASSEHETETEVSGTATITIYDKTSTQDFDAFGNRILSQCVWPDGSRETRWASFTPDKTNWLISLIDVERLESRSPTDVRANRVAWIHNVIGRPTAKILNPGNMVAGQYQPLPKVLGGLETLYVNYKYNPEGTLRRLEAAPAPTATDYAIRSIDITYDVTERSWPTSVANAAGHTSQMAVQPGLGVLAVHSDANGQTSSFHYDRFGRIKHQSLPGGEEIETNYFLQLALPAGVPGVTVSQCEGMAFASGPKLVNVFDTQGRIVATRSQARDDGKVVLRCVRFDGMGRLAAVSRPFFQTDAPRWSTFTYDVLDRFSTISYANGASERFDYDGRSISWTSPSHRSTTCAFDDRNRLIEQVESLGAGAGAAVSTTYAYGPFNTMASIVNGAGMPIRIQYDSLGRPVRVLDPDAHEQKLTYNAFGDLAEVVRGAHNVSFAYDNVGRVQQIDAPEGQFTYSWDTAIHGVGLPASSSSPDGVSIDYVYDSVSRPRAKRWNVNGLHLDLYVSYDTVGRLHRMQYPNPYGGLPVGLGYAYGAFGELINVTREPSGDVLWSRLDSDASGTFAKTLLGNGVTSETIENLLHPGMLEQIHDRTSAGVDVQNLLYRFDADANLVERIDAVTTAREEALFDGLNRLVTWTRRSPAGGLKLEYAYDDVGNIVSAKRSSTGGAGTLNYVYGAGSAGPQAVSSTGPEQYGYDANGNQAGGPSRILSFTSFGLPASWHGGAVTSTFDYDAELSRVGTRTGVGKDASIPGLYEFRGQPHSERFLVSVQGRPVAQIDRQPGVSDTTTYLHVDHLRSLQATTDGAAAPAALYRNDPFGRNFDPAHPGLPPQAGAVAPMIGFAGSMTNAAAGLIDLRGRWYDPTLARFLSPDPLRPMPSRSQRQNAYSYSLNNPLTWRDPTGLDPEDGVDKDVVKSYFNEYVDVHPDDSFKTLNEAVDWSNQQVTAARAVPNDTGWGAAGVAGGSAFPGDANPMAGVFSSSGMMVPDFSEPAGRRQNIRTTITPARPTTGLGTEPTAVAQLLRNSIGNLMDLLKANGLTSTESGNKIRIAAPYEQVKRILDASFYWGFLAWNPIDHPGGKEYRTYDSPGFHFKLADSNDNEFTRITDLHVDLNNPLRPESLFAHILDFIHLKR